MCFTGAVLVDLCCREAHHLARFRTCTTHAWWASGTKCSKNTRRITLCRMVRWPGAGKYSKHARQTPPGAFGEKCLGAGRQTRPKLADRLPVCPDRADSGRIQPNVARSGQTCTRPANFGRLWRPAHRIFSPNASGGVFEHASSTFPASGSRPVRQRVIRRA